MKLNKRALKILGGGISLLLLVAGLLSSHPGFLFKGSALCSHDAKPEGVGEMVDALSPRGEWILLAADQSTFELAENLLCSLKGLHKKQVIVIAFDLPSCSALSLKATVLPFYVPPSLPSDSLLTFKRKVQGEVVERLLGHGCEVIITSVNSIFIRDPSLFWDQNLALEVSQGKSPGLIRVTKDALSLWKTFSEGNEDLPETSKNSDQGWGIIHPRAFFEVLQKDPQFSIFHDASVLSILPSHPPSEVISYLKRMEVWLLNEDQTCSEDPLLLPRPSQEKVSLSIKVLSYDRPVALEQLLGSLDQADFQGETSSLEIFVDFPKDGVSTPQRDENIQVAKNFKWTHGEKSLILRTEHYGLAKQWLTVWTPTKSSEVCMIIEDDMLVSKGFFLYLRNALKKYYSSPEHFDPRFYGIHLQRHERFLGLWKPSFPWTPPRIEAPAFLSRNLGTWGPVMFPFHWKKFLEWQARKSIDPQYRPNVQGLISNEWWIREGLDAVWSIWFIRFIHEHHLFGFYTNFLAKREAFLTNIRATGVHFHRPMGPSNPLVPGYSEEYAIFPDLSELPLYNCSKALLDKSENLPVDDDDPELTREPTKEEKRQLKAKLLAERKALEQLNSREEGASLPEKRRGDRRKKGKEESGG